MPVPWRGISLFVMSPYTRLNLAGEAIFLDIGGAKL